MVVLGNQRLSKNCRLILQYYIDDYSILNFFYCFTFCYEITIFVCYIYDYSDSFNDHSLLAIYCIIRQIWHKYLIIKEQILTTQINLVKIIRMRKIGPSLHNLFHHQPRGMLRMNYYIIIKKHLLIKRIRQEFPLV